VRETAEGRDHLVMMLGPAVVGRPLHTLEQGQLAVLAGHVLMVLERQVEEAAQVVRHQPVLPAIHRQHREMPRQRVGGEGVAGVAKAVARELVQQDQQRQRPLRRLRPVIQLAPGGGEMSRLEPVAEQGVEAVVLGEPFRRTGLFPEGDDGGRRYVCAHDRTSRRPAACLP